MADCDYRRGLLARNAAVITMRSDCDERRQLFERDEIARALATTRRTHIHALARRLLNTSQGIQEPEP